MVFAPKKPVLAIDQEQVKKQLVLLGYESGDNVYLTAFFPKGDLRTKGENRDKGRKAERLNYSEIEAWQSEGRGVYFVVNGYGHGKADVKSCRAVFYEHDDLDKDIQLTLWQSLGLPEPTVQIDTGGKSIHSYWVFDQPIHPDLWAFDEGKGNWKGLQADLLKFADADKSLVNPNRVMRLAGCWYMVNDESGTHAVAQSRIVGGCEQNYSYNDLRGIIPRSETPEVKQERRSLPNTSEETEGLLDFRTVGHLLPHWNDRGRSGWATFQCPVHPSSGKHSDDHIHVNLDKGAWEAHCGCDRKQIYQAVCEIAGHKQKPTGRGYSSGISGGNVTCQKPSIREVVAEAEQILKARFNSQLDLIEANILLEELRREAGLNEYNWEQKYLKPLREKLERSLALPVVANQPTAQTDPSQQLRLELLALIKETDPIKKVRKRAEIASHYGISKGEIEFLCRTLDGDSKTPKAQFFALDDFLNMESDGIDYLIPGFLPRGEAVLCTGLPKSGKTLLAIDAGFAIATGESKFLGEAVQQGRVLLISVDESAQSTKAKLLKRGFRPRDAANIVVMTAWDISQLDALEAKLEDFRPDLVIIDSLKRITAGREISENSAEFADVLYALKELIGRYGAASILIHHSNKNQDATGVSRVRGSTAIVGAVWGIWQMDIPETEDESDGKPSKGKSKQKRFDPTNPNRVFTAICRDTEGALLNIRFNPENHSYGISESDESAQSERKTQEQIILQILAQFAPRGLTGREIVDYSNLGRGVYSVLNRMIEKRLITQRQSTTDARMTVYCLPKSKTPPPPPQSHPVCDQYSSNYPTEKGLEIDHKLITSHKNFDHNIEGDRTYVINSNSQPVTPLVEIDHKNTNKGGEGVSSNPIAKLNSKSITCKQFSDGADPWEEEYTLTNVDADGWGEIVRKEETQPEAIATTPADMDADNCENLVIPVENAPQATQSYRNIETSQPTQQEPAVPLSPAQTDVAHIAEISNVVVKVGDRVHIQAGGKFDGKSVTVLDCSNPDEIQVRLDQAEGGHKLWFPATYLVHIEAEVR